MNEIRDLNGLCIVRLKSGIAPFSSECQTESNRIKLARVWPQFWSSWQSMFFWRCSQGPMKARREKRWLGTNKSHLQACLKRSAGSLDSSFYSGIDFRLIFNPFHVRILTAQGSSIFCHVFRNSCAEFVFVEQHWEFVFSIFLNSFDEPNTTRTVWLKATVLGSVRLSRKRHSPSLGSPI